MGETFEGKVVVVTGGSRGLGREFVQAFAERGANIVVASRKLENCKAVAREVSEQHGVGVMPVSCNVSSWQDCDRLVEEAYAEFDRVDVLINNAGASPRYTSLVEVTEQYFDKVIGLNLRGPFRLTSLVGTRMAASRGGSIINVGSIEAIRPQALALPYAAAKSGLHTLTEGFARAFGPKVRVNTIQPGAFLTDISESWADEQRAGIENNTALGRCGEPSELAGAALYLAGSSSSYVTGALLRVDGGWA